MSSDQDPQDLKSKDPSSTERANSINKPDQEEDIVTKTQNQPKTEDIDKPNAPKTPNDIAESVDKHALASIEDWRKAARQKFAFEHDSDDSSDDDSLLKDSLDTAQKRLNLLAAVTGQDRLQICTLGRERERTEEERSIQIVVNRARLDRIR